MLKIGCHLSVSKGFYEMGKDAVKIDANVIQFFTRNPRGGAAKVIDEEDVKKFKEIIIKENNEMIESIKNQEVNRLTEKQINSYLKQQERIYNFIRKR